MSASEALPRSIEPALRRAAREYAVVTLTGPRQSGKSTVCRRLFRGKPYVTLEAPDVREEALRDPRAFLRRHPKGAVLDEIQRAPDLTSYLQGMVDEDPSPGRWILTGSQHLAISRTVSQSLAGRTAMLELLPLDDHESRRFPNRGEDVWAEVLQGGYPAIRARGLDASEWLSGYVRTYLERDVRDLKQVGDLTAFQTMMRLLAGRTGQLLNLTAVGNDVGVVQATIRAWISVLEATYVVTRVPPLAANVRKRLVKTPKLHFLDSGLVCWLLGVRSRQALQSHPLRGAIFETWVHSEFAKARCHEGLVQNIDFYRDQHGVEADLVVTLPGTVLVVEVKSAETVAGDWFPRIVRVAETVAEALPSRVQPVIVYAGDRASTQQGVRIVPWNAIRELLRTTK